MMIGNLTTNTGSAGSMEAVGAQRIYERSITKNHMRYLKIQRRWGQ